MFIKLNALWLAAVLLGLVGTWPASAEKDYDVLEPYGGPTQTWQDIERSRQSIERRLRELRGVKAGAQDGTLAAPSEKPHRSRKPHRDPSDR